MVTGDGLACKRWVTTGQRRWIKNTEYRRKMVFLSTLRFKICVCVCVCTYTISSSKCISLCSTLPRFCFTDSKLLLHRPTLERDLLDQWPKTYSVIPGISTDLGITAFPFQSVIDTRISLNEWSMGLFA